MIRNGVSDGREPTFGGVSDGRRPTVGGFSDGDQSSEEDSRPARSAAAPAEFPFFS
jgi:hypothetical protein